MLGAVVAGANRHDKQVLVASLDGVVVRRPELSDDARQHICLDLGTTMRRAGTRGRVEAARSTSQAVAKGGGSMG